MVGKWWVMLNDGRLVYNGDFTLVNNGDSWWKMENNAALVKRVTHGE